MSDQHFGLKSAGAVLILGSAAAYYFWRSLKIPPRPTYEIPTKGDPASPIVLIDFPAAPGVASSMSPFVGKLETWMRFQGLPFTKQPGDSTKAPLGKLPYIIHDGKLIPDSTWIIQYLTATYPDKVAKLSPEQEALSTALTACVESRLMLGTVTSRWVNEEGFQRLAAVLFAKLPPGLRLIIPHMVRKNIYGKFTGTGFMAFSDKDQLKMTDTDVAALSTLLGNKKYLTGDMPSMADATLFAFLDIALNDGMMPVMPDIYKKYPNLVGFTERIRKDFFPELAEA